MKELRVNKFIQMPDPEKLAETLKRNTNVYGFFIAVEYIVGYRELEYVVIGNPGLAVYVPDVVARAASNLAKHVHVDGNSSSLDVYVDESVVAVVWSDDEATMLLVIALFEEAGQATSKILDT